MQLIVIEIQIHFNTSTKKVTIHGEKKIKSPLSKAQIEICKITLDSNISDKLLLSRKVQYDEAGEGLIIETNKRKFKVQFDPLKFRPSDVPGNV